MEDLEKPFVVGILNGLAALSLVGGLVVAGVLRPGDPGDGYSWKAAAYFPMIIAVTAGVVQCAGFAAFAKVVAYLWRIEINTRRLYKAD